MSLLNVVKCDACGKIHELGPSFSWLNHGSPDTWPVSNLPDEWYCLVNGNPRTSDSWNFCSAECVGNHLKIQPARSPQGEYIDALFRPLSDGISMQSLASGTIYRPVGEQPDCKSRRFLLVDGETADIREGVKWSSGYVSIDPEEAKKNEAWCHTDWENFKQAYPGSGVQWIDKEESK
jgi:hypothetical protein